MSRLPAFTLPVKSLGETKAVLEFFPDPTKEPDPELEPLFEQIGAQLGRVFEREQSRLSLLRAKQDLEERVVERTRELTGAERLAAIRDRQPRKLPGGVARGDGPVSLVDAIGARRHLRGVGPRARGELQLGL